MGYSFFDFSNSTTEVTYLHANFVKFKETQTSPGCYLDNRKMRPNFKV